MAARCFPVAKVLGSNPNMIGLFLFDLPYFLGIFFFPFPLVERALAKIGDVNNVGSWSLQWTGR
jgi:hypothetical protein